MIQVTENIILRKAELSDVKALFEIKNDLEASSMLGGFSTGYSLSDIQNWISTHNSHSKDIIYLIQLINSGAVIGHVGLYNIDYRIRKAEFAILIAGDQNQGKGFGEACTRYMVDFGFNELNLIKISLSLLSDNSKAYNLYKKCGFRDEGVLKNEQFKNSKYHDIILMAIFNHFDV